MEDAKRVRPLGGLGVGIVDVKVVGESGGNWSAVECEEVQRKSKIK